MGALYTDGVSQPSTDDASLPFTLAETFAVDTNTEDGINPSQIAPTFQQLSTLGAGARQTITDATTFTLDCALGSFHSITLGGNRTAAAFSNPVAGQHLYLKVTQDATGSRTITWNANVDWAANTAPTLSTTAAASDLLEFVYDGTAEHFIGRVFAANYS